MLITALHWTSHCVEYCIVLIIALCCPLCSFCLACSGARWRVISYIFVRWLKSCLALPLASYVAWGRQSPPLAIQNNVFILFVFVCFREACIPIWLQAPSLHFNFHPCVPVIWPAPEAFEVATLRLGMIYIIPFNSKIWILWCFKEICDLCFNLHLLVPRSFYFHWLVLLSVFRFGSFYRVMLMDSKAYKFLHWLCPLPQ